MTIADVQAAIIARRNQGLKAYGVKVNPADRVDLIREVPFNNDAETRVVLANVGGTLILNIIGARILPRPAVPVGTMVVVGSAPDLET